MNKKTGKAIHDYKMIVNNDKVLIGVSGQDSMALAKILKFRLTYLPIKYKLEAVHIEMDKKNSRIIKNFLKELGIKYHVIRVNFEKNKKISNKTKCFWCSWKRREAIFKLAVKLGCKKIAFGHHLDDILETLLLNMFYQGEISIMPPMLKMFKGKFHIIRPFSYAEKALIKKYAQENSIPSMPHECPFGKTTNRILMHKIIEMVKKTSPRVKENLFRSMTNIHKDYLPIKGIG
ncbi:MAG: tRNA 2-thiocytidine(32) synthetase TtcA [Candidatus Omnitrophica bacterium]|nr:tRNA 2-thiocytidine(32) synthetase TtcA [Candidatus Omnitrophota bacterium]